MYALLHVLDISAVMSGTPQLSTSVYNNGIAEVPCHQCNTIPKYIVVYRDGVGDGQVLTVLEHEVSQVRESIKAAAPDCKLIDVRDCQKANCLVLL